MARSHTHVYYVASTHWDREWYEPFQHFRYHLVEVLDEVLDTMARDERFACFQVDGQSIPLEDYLEIRPEREEQVRRFAQAGRLRIGPWYTMPDEHIVAGESLVRNLEEGIRVAGELGNVSRVGFVCDIFGHASQLPQILRGFGIESAFLFRGVNEDTERGLFLWQAPDGSEVVTVRFGPKEGYFDYGSYVRRAFDPDATFDLEEAARRAAEYVDIQRARTGLDEVLFFDGGDHMPIAPQTPDLLEKLRALRADVTVTHAGLDEFAAAVVERAASIPRLVRGELRRPGRRMGEGSWLIPGVLSSRIRLKQANRLCETDLCRWVEPFATLAELRIGRPYPHAYVRRSWRYLLQNHAHDSICGCSPDQVHKDMEYRFDQSRLINTKLIEQTLAALAARVRLPDLEGEQFAVVVFNAAQAPLDGPVDIDLWFDDKTQARYQEFFGYESKIGFRLYTPDGREVPYDYASYQPQRQRVFRRWGKTPQGRSCVVVRVTVPLRIAAMGYTTLICKPLAEPTRHPAGRLVVDDRTLENRCLRVRVEPDGSLTLLDKRSGQTYSRLLVFEDRADIGDGWYHGVAVNDQVFTSAASAADVAVVADGAQSATLRITTRMRVPACFEFDRQMRRSARTVEQCIDSYVTLRAGADHLEIRTVIDNRARDHRLRVLFDSGAQTDTYIADSAFDVVRRRIALPADNHTYRELAVETTPQAGWTAVHDDQRGLAVVAPSLPETAVRDVPARPIALTLLRGFRKTVFTDGEEGGQSLGRHEFHYRLVPLRGEPSPAGLSVLAQQTAAGIRTVQVLPGEQAGEGERSLAPAGGLVELDPGQAIVTAVRRHPRTGAIELRLYNPGDETIDEVVTLGVRITSASMVDLEGNEIEAIDVEDGRRVPLSLAPRRIVTLHVRAGVPPAG